MRLAVTHSGDTDSTGCITGALLGAAHAADVIPDRWLEPLELRAEITALAADYAAVVSGRSDREELSLRYPGC